MKILALNGGGSMGIISLKVLDYIEKKTNKPIFDHFDMFCGVSTGSIISAGLCISFSAGKLLEIYSNNIDNIFGHKRTWVRRIFSNQYPSQPLHDLCKDYFNVHISAAPKRLMVNAVRIDKGAFKPKVFKSWKHDVKMYEAVIASCSAPTYFEPYKIGECTYVDGAVACNNPTVCGIAEAIKFGVPLNNICCLNLACYKQPGFDNPDKINGLAKWLPKLPGSFLGCGDELTVYQAKRFLGEKMLNITPNFDGDMGETNVELLKNVGDMAIEDNKEALDAFIRSNL